MTLTDDDLRRMALGRTDAAPAPPRPFPEITARARRIRRTRAAVGSGLAAAGAGALALTVALVGLPGGGTRVGGDVTPRATRTALGPAASGADPVDCSAGTGFADAIGFDRVPELLYLPSERAAGDPLLLSFARDDRSDCPPPPVAAIWYALDRGAVSARLQVDGPGVTDPYTVPGASFGGVITHESLGGRSVDVYDMAEGRAWLTFYWTEPDGGRWSATVQGLDGAAARAAVAGLSIGSGRVDAGSQPASLPETVAGTGRTPPRSSRYFYAAFKNENEDQGGWTVEVSQAGDPSWQAMLGARPVEVDGVPGWTSTDKVGGLRWTGPGGLELSVHGSIPPAKALEVARSMIRVAPDDPRLVASKEARVPTDAETNTSTGTPTSTP
jgi:hypothetical protein